MIQALLLAAVVTSAPAPPPHPEEAQAADQTPPIPGTVEPEPDDGPLPANAVEASPGGAEPQPPGTAGAPPPGTAAAPAPAAAMAPKELPPPLDPPEVPAYEAPEPPSFDTRFRAALELSAQSFPSGTAGGSQDGFLLLTPLLGVESADDFAFELGAELRGRVLDAPPLQRHRDFERVLRREDWDERSDFGQLLRALKIGADGAAFSLRAGPLGQYTLGRGHLVSRYSNRLNPDYHPAGAVLAISAGPARLEAMASDVLAGRLFAAELAFDVPRLLGALDDTFDRYHVAISAAHDAGAAGLRSDPVTLMSLDADAQLWSGAQLRLFLHGAVGTRLGLASPAVGALLGTTLDGTLGSTRVSGRLEGRVSSGLFRHGFFGYGYELQRFADVGLGGAPITQQAFPRVFSEAVELAFTAGADADVFPDRPQLTFGLAAEHFHLETSRVDWDVNAQLRTGPGVFTVRAGVVGMLVDPRFTLAAEARYRLGPSLYALAGAATRYFPQPEGELVRGVSFSAGLAVDFER